jgi:hypothetical protein
MMEPAKDRMRNNVSEPLDVEQASPAAARAPRAATQPLRCRAAI